LDGLDLLPSFQGLLSSEGMVFFAAR